MIIWEKKLQIMLDDFMVRATLAGIGVTLAAAPLGCFIVWRRMAYFGEATAAPMAKGTDKPIAAFVPDVTSLCPLLNFHT